MMDKLKQCNHSAAMLTVKLYEEAFQ